MSILLGSFLLFSIEWGMEWKKMQGFQKNLKNSVDKVSETLYHNTSR